MLAGETGIDGGELAFAKAVARRAARPAPAARARPLAARLRAVRAAGSCSRWRRGWASSSRRWPRARPTTGTLDAYAGAQARLEHAGGYNWREARQRDAPRPRLPRRAPGPRAGDVLRRRADPRVAGPRAGRRPRPAAARRADQPPRHRVAGVAGGAPAVARRGDRAGGPRPLVPRGRGHGGAGAGGRPRRATSRAAGTPGGPRRRSASSRSAGRSSASRRRSPGWSASSTASAPALARARRSRARSAWTRSTVSDRDPRDGKTLGFALQAARALRPGRVRDRGRAAADRRTRAAGGLRAVAGTGRARHAGRRQRRRARRP